MAAPIRFDFSLAFRPTVAGGIDKTGVLDANEPGAAAVQGVLARVESGELGFWNLPDDLELAGRCHDLGRALRGQFETMVVLGIGGSSLGGRTIKRALSPDSNLIFLDNVDPDGLSHVLDDLDLQTTCFNVISKSGGTVETAAQFCVMRDRLKKAFGDSGYRARTVATTDPSKGLMRALADAEGLKTLSVPANVGGRFSVLSAVGLLPAAFAGVDVKAMLAGAADMRERVSTSAVSENPALLGALLHVAAMDAGKPIHVMMPYVDALRPFAEWYGQLWAESLGKAKDRSGATVNVGPTPVAALGSTDQHSQVQLYMEGPEDKLITFLDVDRHASQMAFPDELPEAYAYLRGHSMAGLIKAEREGTTLALARAGRPSLTVMLPEVGPHALGQLFFFYEAQTAFAGELMNIDAFDQPGVEMGKLIAFGLMGRDGYADALDGLEAFRRPDPGLVFDR